MRVTFNTGFADTMHAINTASEQLLQRQREVASGRRVHVASDDPAAALGIAAEKTETRVLDSYIHAGDSAGSRLLVVDSVLTDLVSALTRAQTQAAAGRNSQLSQTQRDATALAILGERDAIFSTVNTQYQGTYLFAGAKVTTPPYTRTGGVISAYQGDTNIVSVDVSRSQAVAVTLDGNAVLRGSDPADVFAVLTNLASAVQSGDMAGIDQGMSDLQRAFERVTQAQSRVGTDLAGLSEVRSRLDTARRASDTRRSSLEDANLAESISGMTSAARALEAALGALSRANRVSLLDYLK